MMWIWILLAFALIAFFIWQMSNSRGSGARTESSSGSSRSAVEILDDRYARGELEREEYEQKKRDLQR